MVQKAHFEQGHPAARWLWGSFVYEEALRFGSTLGNGLWPVPLSCLSLSFLLCSTGHGTCASVHEYAQS